MSTPTPEEILKSLYTQEVIQPNYIDVGEIKESGDIEIKGPPLPIRVGQGVAAQVHKTPPIARKCTLNLVEAFKPNGKFNHIPNMFLAMAQNAEANDLPHDVLAVGLYDDDTTGVLPKQYVLQLWLVIHRMPDEKKVNENLPVPGQPGLREG